MRTRTQPTRPLGASLCARRGRSFGGLPGTLNVGPREYRGRATGCCLCPRCSALLSPGVPGAKSPRSGSRELLGRCRALWVPGWLGKTSQGPCPEASGKAGPGSGCGLGLVVLCAPAMTAPLPPGVRMGSPSPALAAADQAGLGAGGCRDPEGGRLATALRPQEEAWGSPGPRGSASSTWVGRKEDEGNGQALGSRCISPRQEPQG